MSNVPEALAQIALAIVEQHALIEAAERFSGLNDPAEQLRKLLVLELWKRDQERLADHIPSTEHLERHGVDELEHQLGATQEVHDRRHLLEEKGLLEIKKVLEQGPSSKLAIKTPHLFLVQEDIAIAVKLIDAQFPPYEQVIPKEHKKQRDRRNLRARGCVALSSAGTPSPRSGLRRTRPGTPG